jgi:hypothetical protein
MYVDISQFCYAFCYGHCRDISFQNNAHDDYQLSHNDHGAGEGCALVQNAYVEEDKPQFAQNDTPDPVLKRRRLNRLQPFQIIPLPPRRPGH